MSLTSFIKIPEVRRKFTETFPLPKIELEAELKAPPITKNYSLVGTAFDYLLRFYIKRHNPSAITKKWVAELSLDCIDEGDLETYEKVKKIIDNAKIVYKEYLKTGKITDDIIKSAIMLARVDRIYRPGFIDPEMDVVEIGDIEDLRNLINIVDLNNFNAEEMCLLNPTFGEVSDFVDGADADMVIDNRIIDIKTTKFLRIKRDDFHQLIGYYVLSLIGGVDGAEKDLEIKDLAIYFSRHGLLVPLFEPSKDKFRDFVKWFKKEAEPYNWKY